MTVNTYKIKRDAAAVSRSGGAGWNPFGSVWDQKRRGTWAPDRNDRDLEAQGDGSRLSHAATAPQDRTHSSATADTNQDPEHTQVTEDRSNGNGHAAAGANGIRNRKPEDDASKATGNNQDDDDDDGKSKKKAKSNALYRPVHPKHPFTVANQLQHTLLNSWINVLLVAAPIGIALHYVHSVSPTVVFVVNFVAIIPLAAMLSYATEEIALRTGETLGGLINATFGNAVELIVAIIALIKGEIVVVQTSLIGSILSNLLLVMGFCFFFGGLRRREQHFNTTVAQTAASLLALAVASVIVPTVFELKTNADQTEIAKLSRGTAVILLLVYFAYLFFQLHTHLDVFNEESKKVAARPWTHGQSIKEGFSHMPGASALMRHAHGSSSQEQNLNGPAAPPIKDPEPLNAEEEEEDEEDPKLHFLVAVGTLLLSTVIIALCAEFMVDSIDSLTKTTALRKEFVGLILLPIVGNAAEHATAVTVAIKDKMDLAIGVAVGSSMQVALFLIPLLVIIGWGLGNEYMDLSLDEFQVAVMFVAVLLTNYLIGDGKSHWLEGFLLICLYAIIATCSFFYPDGQ
ncbi:Calcium/proton exchanger superfamily [Cordyceps fumosorosea ARSEF 2679]|uniref:Vacuolar calcium ion transporter n=1 Tax=Cordyceps fumosorosea (strain ARSEF 2679) TaxID=1081104 RepID=A0A167V7J0_CORFA|nr:Calcium/proton exchanger superfamily [Cordyceps fumosorosea ARSEF 2679]OAA62310.1 Calcium/proton exchanger superfamily [Cordyceps fumosorosea ARSEF 2679]